MSGGHFLCQNNRAVCESGIACGALGLTNHRPRGTRMPLFPCWLTCRGSEPCLLYSPTRVELHYTVWLWHCALDSTPGLHPLHLMKERPLPPSLNTTGIAAALSETWKTLQPTGGTPPPELSCFSTLRLFPSNYGGLVKCFPVQCH